MTALAVVENKPRSVLADMSQRYGMEPAAFEATIRATVCKGNVSREEFAAFLLVAKEYRLNPLTKEVYAFPAKGGGIQPIVSIDGWARIINEQPALDGVTFHDALVEGELIAVTCAIHRKDRSIPTEVTEYMAECKRNTDVWRQWPARMLRHKALIQCARYAFGFSGIIDPDEFERMQASRPASINARVLHAEFDEPAQQQIAHDPVTGEIDGEAATEAEFTTDPAPDPYDDDTFPADRPSTTREAPDEETQSGAGGDQPAHDLAGTDVDILDWAASFNRGVEDMQDPDEVKKAMADAKRNGFLLKLKAKSESLFEALREAANRKVIQLEGRRS